MGEDAVGVSMLRLASSSTRINSVITWKCFAILLKMQ